MDSLSAYYSEAKSEGTSESVQKDLNKGMDLEANIQLLLSVDQGKSLTLEEREKLDKFLTGLVEDDKFASTVEQLAKMKAKGILIGLQNFVRTMRPHHLAVFGIEKKIDKEDRLTPRECGLVDSLIYSEFFARNLQKAGIKKNPHVNRIVKINAIAEQNNFVDYNEGDVLFYNQRAQDAYNGESSGFATSIGISALGTPDTHVGVFYRDSYGKPYISHIQDKHKRHRLSFGMQSFIHAKRVDPVKFMATNLEGEARLGAQELIGSIFARIVKKDWKIKFSYLGGVTCILSNKSWKEDIQLGKVKLEDETEMLCSEFAAKALMQAFQEFNAEQFLGNGKVVELSNPFNSKESLSRLHPERLLVAFGPHDQGKCTDSGWEEVTRQNEFVRKMLPHPAPFHLNLMVKDM